MATFATAINCMDGRVQGAVRKYMKGKYGVNYVDKITQPGICKVLAENSDIFRVNLIREMVEISVKHHGSKIIAIAAHYNCAGNPVTKEDQIGHLKKAKRTVESFGFNTRIILLWINEEWMPESVSHDSSYTFQDATAVA